MLLRLALLPAALLTAGCLVTEAKVSNKPGVAPAAFAADRTACTEIALRQDVSTMPPASGSLATSAATGFAQGIADGIEEAKAEQRAFVACMAERGYTQITLSEAETAALKRMSRAERTARLAVIAGETR